MSATGDVRGNKGANAKGTTQPDPKPRCSFILPRRSKPLPILGSLDECAQTLVGQKNCVPEDVLHEILTYLYEWETAFIEGYDNPPSVGTSRSGHDFWYQAEETNPAVATCFQQNPRSTYKCAYGATVLEEGKIYRISVRICNAPNAPGDHKVKAHVLLKDLDTWDKIKLSIYPHILQFELLLNLTEHKKTLEWYCSLGRAVLDVNSVAMPTARMRLKVFTTCSMAPPDGASCSLTKCSVGTQFETNTHELTPREYRDLKDRFAEMYPSTLFWDPYKELMAALIDRANFFGKSVRDMLPPSFQH